MTPGCLEYPSGLLKGQEAMSKTQLSAEERTTRRARWESFEFVVPTVGEINICNMSYGADDARNHIYTVSVEGRRATDCTCPAAEYRPGECKHQPAVENTPAVMAAASAKTDDARPCDCCPPDADLPGWRCYRAANARMDGGEARCPVCSAPVRSVATIGPDEHRAQPCGHRVSGAYAREFYERKN